MAASGPRLRPFVHAATGLFALALAVLPHSLAIACGALGVFAGWVVFPLSGFDKKLRREGEPFLGGLRTYPVAVLGLVILLPPAEAAAAWAVLAFGDSAAAVVGGAIPAPRLLRHPKATLSGTTAHVVVGGLAAWGMGQAVGAIGHGAAWVDPGPVPGALAAFLAAGAAAAVDLLLRLPDDNLPGAAAAGFVLRAARGLL